jgi:hypothetical protein
MHETANIFLLQSSCRIVTVLLKGHPYSHYSHLHTSICRQLDTTHTTMLQARFIFWANIHMVKSLCGQMSFWTNVYLGKSPSWQTSSGQTSCLANVLLGNCLLGKFISGQISFWANVLWANSFLVKCLSGQMS